MEIFFVLNLYYYDSLADKLPLKMKRSLSVKNNRIEVNLSMKLKNKCDYYKCESVLVGM